MAMWAAVFLLQLFVYGVQSQTFRFGNDMKNHEIDENTPVGTKIYTLEATYRNDESFSYTVQSPYFRMLDTSSGDVYVAAALNYEKITEIPVTVTATNADDDTIERHVTVFIRDINVICLQDRFDNLVNLELNNYPYQLQFILSMICIIPYWNLLSYEKGTNLYSLLIRH